MASLDFFTLIGLTSLIVQLAVLFLLFYGYYLKSKLKFMRHGIVMVVATLLHFALIFAIMVPSLVIALLPSILAPFTLLSAVILIHAITGSIAVALAALLAGLWRFRKNYAGCINRKNWMLPTLGIWVFSLILGIILFAIFYGPALVS
jgi:hypothetical protein